MMEDAKVRRAPNDEDDGHPVNSRPAIDGDASRRITTFARRSRQAVVVGLISVVMGAVLVTRSLLVPSNGLVVVVGMIVTPGETEVCWVVGDTLPMVEELPAEDMVVISAGSVVVVTVTLLQLEQHT